MSGVGGPPGSSSVSSIPMFIIDTHLDIALNALEYNRDYRLPVSDIRALERGMTDKIDRGNNVVSLPDLRRGNVGERVLSDKVFARASAH